MPREEIEMIIKLPIKIIKRKKWYVADCPVLDVASQGDTANKAKKNLIEALSVFLATCIEHGTLDDVMKQCGFKPVKASEKKAVSVKPSDYVNIPIHLLSSESYRGRCHV
jgi:predicted RNase H-like HicB family nuclease